MEKKILSSKRGRKKKKKKKDLGLKIRSEQHKYLIWQEGQTFSTYIHNSLSHKKHITYDESDKTNCLPLELSKLYGKTFTGVCFCPAYNISVPNTKQVKSYKLSKAKCYVFSVTVQLELELMTFVH